MTNQQFPDRIDSKFRYVLLASARAEQIMRGARPKVEVPTNKPTSMAMKEVTDDIVEWGYGQPPTDEEVAAEALSGVGEEEEVH
ncbi:MAG TPA: DNA-directed RNA polymerase subunit omega [Thermoanaerobaculia bacterium]|nr:DNA-directed RNA polymerase subunit omega [Thermoanaerobaculia bacterium]